ncbi:MAG: hypothetical protein RSE64_08510 [Oscillospiraceae bacterium]
MNFNENLTPEQREAKILECAIETFGAEAQIVVAIEELSELIKALTKFLRADGSQTEAVLENIREELADVSIMLNQLELIFGGYSDIECAKLERLISMLEERGAVFDEAPMKPIETKDRL